MKNEKIELLEESVKGNDSTLDITEQLQAGTPSAKELDERVEKLLYAAYSYWLTKGKTWDTLPDNIKEILTESHSSNEYLFGLVTRLEEKRHRTRAKSGLTTNYPPALIANTAAGYENSITLRESGNAYMMKLSNWIDGLNFEDGKLHSESPPETTKEGIEGINLPLLRYFYSIVYQQFEATGVPNGKISLYIPDLARATGHKSNINEQIIKALFKDIHEFQPLIGRIGESWYQVLQFYGYDAETNTISFYSPYMEKVIEKIFWDNTKCDKRGKIIKNKRGIALREPTHSYLMKSSIVKEKNKHAVNNVGLIIRIIEQAGNNTPHVTARWLLENNTQFMAAFLNITPKNRPRFIKNVFKRTLQLLRTHTRLAEVYRDMELPDPDDAANIPTQKTLGSVIYSFPHNGKGKRGGNRGLKQ